MSIATDLLESLGKSMASSVGSAIAQPIVGWLQAYLGFGGDNTAADFKALESQLAGIVQSLTTLQDSINVLGSNVLAVNMDASVSDSQALSSPNGAWQPFGQLLSDLNDINNGMIGSSGQESYIAAYIKAYAPRLYTDSALGEVLTYYATAQIALATMLVELCHLGQGWSETSDPLWQPAPCNYQGAAQYLIQCYNQVQQQKSQFPFPTSGVGYTGALDGMGSDQIVMDKTPPGGEAPISWAFKNMRNGGIYGLTSNPQPLNMGVALGLVNSASFWPLRVAAYNELQSLAAANAAAATPFVSGVNSGSPVPAQQPGVPFHIVAEYAGGTATFPCAGREAFDPGNWSANNDFYGGIFIWNCGWFYDILANQSATVSVQYPSRTGNGVFADIATAESITITRADGTQAYPSVNDYMDAMLVYRPTSADPPLEEPSALSLVRGADSADGSTTRMTLTGTFERFQAGSTGPSPCQVDVSQYAFWTLEAADAAIATISNAPPSAGTITWLSPGAIHVTAQRGALTAGPVSVSPGAAFQPTKAEAAAVNISPRGSTNTTTSQTNVQFNMQILYSDGSVSAPPIESDSISPVNKDFTFAISDTTVCQPVAGSPGNFTVSGSNASGQISITATLNGTTLSDTAIVTVPFTAQYDAALA